MMLKVNGEYLDFDGDIDVDRQVKLFESIDEAAGDFSYSFNLPWTSKNIKALGFPLPDNRDKTVYETNDAEVIGDDGMTIFRGSLRPELLVPNIEIQCSFFSGNSNWFSLLVGDMASLRLSQYDADQTMSNIFNSFQKTSGVVWPIFDAGALSMRRYVDLKTEDFIPCFYVKTLMQEIFQQAGIKITGELLNDWTYNHIIIAANNGRENDIKANSSYVQKTSTTTRASELVRYKITFDNDSILPYYDGSNDNFDLPNSRWVAPYKMRIRLECSLRPSIINDSYNNRIYLYINGVFTFVDIGLASGTGGLYNSSTPGDSEIFSINRTLEVQSGDTIEVYSEWQQSTGSTQNDVISGSLKITPLYIYKALGNSVVPNWTKQEFVNNILSLFNVITAYDPVNKTVTLNLFEKLKTKNPIDISEFVEVIETDYAEFISDYGKENKFFYQESDSDNLNEVNIYDFMKYKAAVIESNNDFIQDSVDVLESDFMAPITYLNGTFDMSMERAEFIDFDTENTEITSITTPGLSAAHLNVAADIFMVNDLIRISESTNEYYNGDWVVRVVGTGYIQCNGMVFDTDATANISRLLYKLAPTDDVYIFINIPNYDLYNVNNIGLFYLDQSQNVFTAAIAYFNLLDTDKQINHDFRQGLSFEEVEDVLFYQRTMLQTYWPTLERILNDPVKLRIEATLPWKVHNDIDFLRPIMIRTLETTNLYYLNLERGYKGSHLPCEMELIKLS